MRINSALCLYLAEIVLLYFAVFVALATIGGKSLPWWLSGIAGVVIGRWVARYLHQAAVEDEDTP